MPPPQLYNVYTSSLPDHCEPSSPFLVTLSAYLHLCTPTPLALVSTILGSLSLISWLFAQLPQIYTNYQLQSTTGLSLFFLVEWCLGDAGNLIGSILTRQTGWQIVIAVYYVLVDITLVVQFVWYTHVRKRWGYQVIQPVDYSDSDFANNNNNGDDGSAAVLDGVSPSSHSNNETAAVQGDRQSSSAKQASSLSVKDSPKADGQSPSCCSINEEKKLGLSSSQRSVSNSAAGNPGQAFGRTVLLTSMAFCVLANAAPTSGLSRHTTTAVAEGGVSALEVIGRIASWISSILYLFSRPPQLYKNYCRKSTQGLSPLLFMAAFCGNFLYSASLLTNPNAWFDFPPHGGGGWADEQGNSRWEWIGRTLPFFLGAAGVLALDALMGLQFLTYGSDEAHEPLLRVDQVGKNGRHSRWMKVHGWMRGWIPSVSPERKQLPVSVVPCDEEAEALLARDVQERGSAGYGSL